MCNRPRRGLRGAAIAFALILLGFAQASGADDADDSSEFRSVAVAGPDAATDVDFMTARNAGLEPVADYTRDNAEVIEEIIVIGTKKGRPNLSRDPAADPLIRKPSQLDWQLFPVYDPDRAPLHAGHDLIDDQIRRAGFIEVFRIRFGR